MAKTYEQKMKEFKNACINHAHLATNQVRYFITSVEYYEAGASNPVEFYINGAAHHARVAARYALQAHPELAE